MRPVDEPEAVKPPRGVDTASESSTGSPIRTALDALAAAGVAYATRGEQPIDDPPPGGDVDVLVSSSDLEAADRELRAAGLRWLEAPGHRGHRFYLVLDTERSRWLKLDVALVPDRDGWDLSARDAASLARFAAYRVGTKAEHRWRERLVDAVALRRPVARRRLGPVVAVLGPDGSGKGSVIAAVERELPVRVTAVYLGYGGASRGEYRRRQPGARAAQPRAERTRALKTRVAAVLDRLPPALRESEWRTRHLGLACLRLVVAYAYAWRGDVVVCDRHPVEHLALGSPVGGPLAWLERRLLESVVPWPDAIVILDAPADVLWQRKPEHPQADLEAWRRAYRRAFEPRGAVVVSTAARREDAVADVAVVLWRALKARRGW